MNLSPVKMGALEDEYNQNAPCLLYPSLTRFDTGGEFVFRAGAM
jgi:hypothetical protein